VDATEKFEAWLEGQGQRLLDPLTRVDELLIYLNRSQARTETLQGRQMTALDAIARSGGITVGDDRLPAPAIPMNPQSITEILMGLASEISGRVVIVGYQYALVVPAFGTLHFTQVTPDGWVLIYAYQMSFTSDFYSSSLLVTGFTVAGKNILSMVVPLTVSITVPWSIIPPVYAKSEIEINFANLTSTDAEITLMGTAIGLEKVFWAEFYMPLLRKGYATLEEVLSLASE